MSLLVSCARCFKPMLVSQLPTGKTYCSICRGLLGLPDDPANAPAPSATQAAGRAVKEPAKEAQPAGRAVSEKPAPSFKGRREPAPARSEPLGWRRRAARRRYRRPPSR